MAKRKSHGARRAKYYKNPYGGHGFRDHPDGRTWDQYGSGEALNLPANTFHNPYGGHGFRDAPDGRTWDQYGASVPRNLPPNTFHNPSTGQLLFWGAVAAAAAYILWKRPDLPGEFDDWLYGKLPSGTPLTGNQGTPGGVTQTGDVVPGISNASLTVA